MKQVLNLVIERRASYFPWTQGPTRNGSGRKDFSEKNLMRRSEEKEQQKFVGGKEAGNREGVSQARKEAFTI